ncbi:hypothetical protein GCM10028806_56750 [Spirosoma terrae]|uniref:Uncharacterized protein n=1 Tax=Spirosoma terrae TaxID=1968276 RepID=A0A6L9LEB8_9BACT|nr:hypothetical protein [Spirosoma terrae]NDU96868.1 hypothetical protein [Spirosoma terrae]
MKFFSALIVCCASFNFVYGQNSLIQDTKGETSLIINQNSNRLLSINVADASIGLSVLDKNSGKKSFWGGLAKFKTSENVATLLTGNVFNPSVDLSAYLGRYIKSDRGKVRIWYVAPSIKLDAFKVLESNSLNNKYFFGGSVKGGFNKIGKAFKGTAIIGYSGSIGYLNNTSDLKTVDVYTRVEIDSTVILKNKKSGFVDNYQKFFGARLNIDYAVFPFKNYGYISIAVYGRGQLWGYQPTQKAGIGIFVGQQGAPTKIVAGIAYQVNDIFNAVSDEPTFLKRTGVNLVAGFNF